MSPADDSEVSDIPAVSNVRQDLTEWQEKHANLVLATVKVDVSVLKVSLIKAFERDKEIGLLKVFKEEIKK